MVNKTKLLIATSNQGKLKEFSLLLSDFKIISQKSLNIDPKEETGTTFYENSLHKARVGAIKSGLLSLGDDSGLIVPALGNMPGLNSARYAHDSSIKFEYNKTSHDGLPITRFQQRAINEGRAIHTYLLEALKK